MTPERVVGLARNPTWFCALGRTRTCSPLFRRQICYPITLRGLKFLVWILAEKSQKVNWARHHVGCRAGPEPYVVLGQDLICSSSLFLCLIMIKGMAKRAGRNNGV